MTGNLNLGTGLFIDASHMTKNGDALLALNGSLTVNGSLLLENADDVSWGARNIQPDQCYGRNYRGSGQHRPARVPVYRELGYGGQCPEIRGDGTDLHKLDGRRGRYLDGGGKRDQFSVERRKHF